MTTLAEGVETAEQWRVLGDLGCDALQGFLCSEPAPASRLDAALALGRYTLVAPP
jgi:EAL domain-containing protein (putative c-di-GMP-specific phosphodiesterase class I)